MTQRLIKVLEAQNMDVKVQDQESNQYNRHGLINQFTKDKELKGLREIDEIHLGATQKLGSSIWS